MPELAERALVEHARTARALMAGNGTASAHRSRDRLRRAAGNRFPALVNATEYTSCGLEVLEVEHTLEELQRVIEAIAEEMHVAKIHERNGFVIAVTLCPGQLDRRFEDGFSLVPLALGDERLTLHRTDVETHVGRRRFRRPAAMHRRGSRWPRPALPRRNASCP